MTKTRMDLERELAIALGVKPRRYGWMVCNPEGNAIVLQSDYKSECEGWLAQINKRPNSRYIDYKVASDNRYPEYASDLNAVREAALLFKEQNPKLYVDYIGFLHAEYNGRLNYAEDADAISRLLALLKALGKAPNDI